MLIQSKKIRMFYYNNPLLSILLILNFVGIILISFHYYSINRDKQQKENALSAKVLNEMIAFNYPSRFLHRGVAVRLYHLTGDYQMGGSPRDSDVKWILSKFNSPVSITGNNLLMRYTQLLNALYYGSLHMTLKQKQMTYPVAIKILSILPKGSNHILALNTADLIANLGNTQAVPILENMIELYPEQQDKTRLKNTINCLETGKLVL